MIGAQAPELLPIRQFDTMDVNFWSSRAHVPWGRWLLVRRPAAGRAAALIKASEA